MLSSSCEEETLYNFYVVGGGQHEYSSSDLILSAESPTARLALPVVEPDAAADGAAPIPMVATVVYGWASSRVVKIGVGENLRVVAAHLPRHEVSLLLERAR